MFCASCFAVKIVIELKISCHLCWLHAWRVCNIIYKINIKLLINPSVLQSIDVYTIPVEIDIYMRI